MVINIIARDAWHAEPAKMETPTNWKVTHVFWMNVKRTVCYTKIHCIEILKRAQRYNMAVQNQRDIRYNFMIGGDGNVYEGRGWGNTPLLPKEYSRVNSESVVVGFTGNFNTARDLPDAMFHLGQDLVAYGVGSDFIAKDFQFFDLLSPDPNIREQPRLQTRGRPESGNPNYTRYQERHDTYTYRSNTPDYAREPRMT